MFRPGPPLDQRALPERFAFGRCEVELGVAQLRRDGEKAALEPRAFDLLLLLAANPHRVVEKDEIFARLWPGVAVTDNALTRVVAQLRRELADDAEHPAVIETVRTRGYRFLPEIEALDVSPAGEESASPASPEPAPRAGPHRGVGVPLVGLTALAIVVLAIFAWRPPSAPPRPAALSPGAPRQLTSSDALDAEPALAPDGSAVVYVSDRSGSPELWLKQLPSGEERALTADGRCNVEPSFSADGRWIAYTAVRDRGIWRIPASGGERRRVTDFGSHPSFSPDGRKIVFQSQEALALNWFGWVASHDSTLWVTDLTTGVLRQITRMGSTPGGQGAPVWSPDGRWIVFASNDLRVSGIWRMPAAGGDPVRLASTAGWLWSPTFTQDGRSVFALRMGFGPSLIRISTTPRKSEAVETVLPLLPAGFTSPSLSRDGSKLAYTVSATRGEVELLPVTREGASDGPPRDLVPPESTRLAWPVFTLPDGKWVVFSRLAPGSRSGVVAVNPATGERHDYLELTGGPVALGEGEVLLKQHDEEARPGWVPVLLDPGSGKIRSFSGFPEFRSHLTELAGANFRFSADGSTVVFFAREGGRYVLRLWREGGRWPPPPLVALEFADWPAISDDGREVAFERLGGAHSTDLWAVHADGSGLRLLAGGPGQAWTGGWSHDDRRFAFVALRDGAWNVWTVGADGRGARQVTENRSFATVYRYPKFSPRGDLLVTEKSSTTGDIWLLRLDGAN